MARFDYDLFTLGAGSGGVRASRMAGARGARVGIAEPAPLGGTCVNLGCIPKKLLVHASHLRHEIEDAERGYGWTVGPARFDWATFRQAKDAEIARLNGVYARLLDQAGVDVLRAQARVLDAHTVELEDVDGGARRRVTAEHLLVAVGSWPVVPDVSGAELAITSNEVFHLEDRPGRVLIVGGGYIGVEFAGIFHGLGTRVTQIYRGPLFLRGFDDALRTGLADEMRKAGIDLRFESDVASIAKAEEGLRVELTDGSELEVDRVLFATGRRPRTPGLGLEEAGVELSGNGAVVVDELSRSSVRSIWAIGDATDRINLTPVAIHEGMCLAETLFGRGPTAPVHDKVASAVFSQPPIGTVGLSEAAARERGLDVEIYQAGFRPLKHTLTGRDTRAVMKLVVDRPSDRVLGVHVLGPDAAEIVQGFAVALQCDATKAQLDATIGIHPTTAEELVTMREPVSA